MLLIIFRKKLFNLRKDDAIRTVNIFSLSLFNEKKKKNEANEERKKERKKGRKRGKKDQNTENERTKFAKVAVTRKTALEKKTKKKKKQ